MSALTEYQKKRCPLHLDCESWKECSKCSNGRVTEGFAGSNASCSLKQTIPKVLTVIGRNKKEILEALPEIEDLMSHGFIRGKVIDVYWNMDGKVPDYFTVDYDAIPPKGEQK